MQAEWNAEHHYWNITRLEAPFEEKNGKIGGREQRNYWYLWSDWRLPERVLLLSGRNPGPPPVRLAGLRTLQETAEPLHEAGSPLCVQRH